MTREEVAEAMAAPSELTIEGPFVTVNMANVVDVKHRNTLAALCRMLREALNGILREAVVLSEDYLRAFEAWPDDAVIQGWEKARWLRAVEAAKAARAVLAMMPTEGESDDTTT